MSTQPVPIHRTNNILVTNIANKNDKLFDPFNYAVGQDHNIRWLSRPNQQLAREKYRNAMERFNISFDVENFQPEQIKIYIENRKLTIRGVYEERTEGRHTQKEFEKSFDLPDNTDIELMACYITPRNMLVVEIPLNPDIRRLSTQMDLLNVSNDANQRRLSFSLNKFNTLNNQGLASPSNNLSALPPTGQQARRTSVTKTTTTTTTTGLTPISPEAEALLRNADIAAGTAQTHNTCVTERRVSNSGNQQLSANQSNPSSTVTSTNTVLSSLSDAPIEIPPELLATGGTITILKRKVSVTKSSDPPTSHTIQVPIPNSNSTNSPQAKITTTSIQAPLPQPITPERRNSQTISTNTLRKMFTLEEFLQNKVWNPSLIDGPNGKKILIMRLQMKPGTQPDQLKVTLNGLNLRIEIENTVTTNDGQTNEKSYRQINLFPTCEVEQLTTKLRNDGFLYIQVPIKV